MKKILKNQIFIESIVILISVVLSLLGSSMIANKKDTENLKLELTKDFLAKGSEFVALRQNYYNTSFSYNVSSMVKIDMNDLSGNDVVEVYENTIKATNEFANQNDSSYIEIQSQLESLLFIIDNYYDFDKQDIIDCMKGIHSTIDMNEEEIEKEYIKIKAITTDGEEIHRYLNEYSHEQYFDPLMEPLNKLNKLLLKELKK